MKVRCMLPERAQRRRSVQSGCAAGSMSGSMPTSAAAHLSDADITIPRSRPSMETCPGHLIVVVLTRAVKAVS